MTPHDITDQSDTGSDATERDPLSCAGPHPEPETATRITQTDRLIRALSRKRAPSLKQIGATLGWQPHTVRAAISRLRKSGVQVETVRSETGGVTTYRLIASAPGNAPDIPPAAPTGPGRAS